MIQKIILENFEAHIYTEIVMLDGVYIIAGNSNAGKSSIFRALRWVFLNTPGGEDFINFNAQECTVTVILDGNTIKRTKARANKKNEYWLNDKVYKAFGQSVPDEIQQVIGLNDINFEWQFDKRPFLISETGGYIASKLNEIVNLELIDSSLRNIESTRREQNNLISRTKEQIAKLEEQIDALSWVDQAEADLHAVEHLQSLYNNLQNKKVKLHEYVEKIDSDYNTLAFMQIISDKQIEQVLDLIKNYQALQEQYKIATGFVDTYTRLTENKKRLHIVNEQDIQEVNDLYSAFDAKRTLVAKLKNNVRLQGILETQKEQLGEVISDRRIAQLMQNINEYEPLLIKKESMKVTVRKYYEYQKMLGYVKDDMLQLQQKYKEIAPDICPLCGNPFNKELDNEIHIHH
jgi:exonuclease SbcC